MDYSIINTENNLFTVITVFFCTIFPAIPFIVVDLYYSLLYTDKTACLNSVYFEHINMRSWLFINGTISASSVVFTFLIFLIIYTDYLKCLSTFFQSTFFIKFYVVTKLSFNIAWTIIGTIMFSSSYYGCSLGLKVYIWIRISIMFLFISLSIEKIRKYLFNTDQRNRNLELNNINNTNI